MYHFNELNGRIYQSLAEQFNEVLSRVLIVIPIIEDLVQKNEELPVIYFRVFGAPTGERVNGAMHVATPSFVIPTASESRENCPRSTSKLPSSQVELMDK